MNGLDDEMDPLVKLKFTSSKRKIREKSPADSEKPVSKKPVISSSNLSAEQKFDALFGSTGSFNSAPSKVEPTPRTSPQDKRFSPKKETVKPLSQRPKQSAPVIKATKKRSKLDKNSPFALAFGCVDSDDDDNDDSTFVADEKEDEMSAQDQWDTIMNETVKNASDPPTPKISSLRSLARNSKSPEKKESTEKSNGHKTEEKSLRVFSSATIDLPVKPKVMNKNTESTKVKKEKLQTKAEFEMEISPIKPDSNAPASEASKPSPFPPPSLKAPTASKTNSKEDAAKPEAPGRPFREKRFFKSKTKIDYQEDANDPYKTNTSESRKGEKVQGPAEIRVPIADKMSDEQISNEGLQDDAKFYLDGVKPGTNDISSRALTAISFAKRLNDEEFRVFLAKNKLPAPSKAHNLGQLIVLYLGDATDPEKTTASYALAAAIALHKVCLYKNIGCSKIILALIVKLLKLKLPSSKAQDKDLPRIQRDADSIIKDSASVNPDIPCIKPISSGWTHNTVAAETVYLLCINTKKPVFNTICIISKMLNFLVEKVVEIISVKSTSEINRTEFNKIFDAFEAQTKPYKKALEVVVNETEYLEAVGKFLKITGPENMKTNGYANRITRHLINLCCESDHACFKMAQLEFLPYILDMIVKFPKSSLLTSQDEKKHSLKIGVAILLNLTMRSPACRMKMQKEENFRIILDVLNDEMTELKRIHDGDVSMAMSKTTLDAEFGEDIKGMSEEEQQQLGKMVNKADAHVKGCMTVAYCAIMVAKLIQANQFILDDVRGYLSDGAIKYSLQCFDEVDNILKLSGKEDDVSAEYMKEAREIFAANNLTN
ncbi:Oidioi.mRNA.OKI2018_I69.PAR.g12665.t1.cds [Oikopleura dioica]|uniref:Oidioi.mRNA.OKI2018_I69.PAR.g12665.t1.cds n=1 Tax=Oikopleura dioica TaxID=34765 RepID=A0ABN7S4Y3_OIKDI|nr:Oidioi.mRNA.OKI2018_I69.PAR.g12665.t1.cds [Oikopleura dioica]